MNLSISEIQFAHPSQFQGANILSINADKWWRQFLDTKNWALVE
jgi:hypothetical protein